MKTIRQLRTAAICSFAIATIGLCSCRSPQQTALADPFAQESPARELASDAPDVISSSGPGTAIAEAEQPFRELKSTPPGHPTIPAVAAEPSEQLPIQLATFTPAEPREPIQTAAYVDTNHAAPVVHANHSSGQYPDEYLFDGGDRGDPVHYSGYDKLELDTEDTIAEYVDHVGESHLTKSNRVAVYSPRFGAVRTISGVESGVSIEKLGSASDAFLQGNLKNRVAATQHAGRDQSDAVRVRSRASGLGNDSVPAAVEQRALPTAHVKLLNLYEDLAFTRTGELLESEKARIDFGVQAAQAWTRVEFPVIAAVSSAGMEVDATFKAADLTGSEDMRRPGRLRILKLADKKTASPGDTVAFTIRYDNLGDLDLEEIVIVDNLTPRLEFVEGSITSDRPGELFLEDNDAGSLILRFKIEGNLSGRTGGVITFHTKVR